MLALFVVLGLQGDGALVLSPDEARLALDFSPLPAPPDDPTNRYDTDPRAARLGQALFFDTRMSANGEISCATCHDPDQSWADGRKLAKALQFNPRNTQSLWNVAYNRWFFWDGRKDSLWSQALGPFEDPREHGSSRLEVLHTVAGDADLSRAYERIFGALPPLENETRFPRAGRPVPGVPGDPHQLAWNGMSAADRNAVDDAYANLGKSIAAFERQLVSRDAPFDRFVRGLRSGDDHDLAQLSPSAQRGFALFVGKANCHVCHDGPNFSDSEFHTNRVPTAEGVDPGRPLGKAAVLRDPFNGAGRHADDGGALARLKLRFPPSHSHLPGEFKTPTLRNVARTAPYMHEGQIETLAEVVAFYSSLEGAAPLSAEGERLLARPLDLTAAEQADLVAFLESLTDEELPRELTRAPESAVLE